MKDLDSDKLNELLGLLTDAVKSGTEQLPGVAAEWLTWQQSSCYFFLAMGTLFLVAGLVAVAAFVSGCGKYMAAELATISGGAAGILGAALIARHLYLLLYLATAPRAYLLEYLLK